MSHTVQIQVHICYIFIDANIDSQKVLERQFVGEKEIEKVQLQGLSPMRPPQRMMF